MGKPLDQIEQDWQLTKDALDRNNWSMSKAAADLTVQLGRHVARQTVESRIIAARARKWIGDGPPLDGFAVKGTSTLYDAEGGVKATWVKTARDGPGPEEIAVQVREALDGYKPPAPLKTVPKATEEDLATVYPLSDWHVGLLSWKKETGQNYDLKIAKATIETAMERLVASSPQSSQGVILGLGDLLHSDNFDGMTTKSKNILDVDGRYPKILSAATQLILFTIDLALQRHGSVLVRILPGNHDEHSAIAVTLALSLHYQGNERVTVDDDAGRFWWWSFGKVFLGATHGDKAKMKDLPLIMAARNPRAWGEAKFRHCFTGHVHNDRAIEMNGVTVESLQSPVAADAWHHQHGYGAGRSVQSRTYHKTEGEIMRQRVNII